MLRKAAAQRSGMFL